MTYWVWKERLGTISLLESCTEEGVVIIDVRDLKDGKGNNIQKIKEKIELVANLLSAGQKIAVRCAGGISRSNAIACAVLVYIINGYSWEEPWVAQWSRIKKRCPRAQENPDLIREVKQALRELGRNVD